MVAKNRKQFEFKLGKAGFSLFVLGMAIGLFATFLFGVTIGKNIDTYPASITGYIPAVIGERFGWKSEKTMAAGGEGKKEIASQAEGEFDLTFYDTLSKKKEGDIILQRPGEKTSSANIAPALPPPGASVPAGKTPTVMPGKPPLAAETKPAPQPGSARPAKGTLPSVMPNPSPPAAVPAPGAVKLRQPDQASAEKMLSGKGKFAVQLASYKDKPKAEQLSRKLTALGYRPHIVSAEVPQKGMWYRVTLSGFDSFDQAKQASAGVAAKVPGVKGVIHRGK